MKNKAIYTALCLHLVNLKCLVHGEVHKVKGILDNNTLVFDYDENYEPSEASKRNDERHQKMMDKKQAVKEYLISEGLIK